MIIAALLMAAGLQSGAETIVERDYRLCLSSWSLVVDGSDDVAQAARAVAAHCADKYWLMVAQETRGGRSMGFISNYDFALPWAQSARRNRRTAN